MKSVGNMLRSKGSDIWSVAPDDTVYDALKLMAEKNVGAVLVFDEGCLVGIMSERDYARKVILHGKAAPTTKVREIMTPRVICVRTDQRAEECMAIMTDKHVRHLPVIENNEIVGVLSIGDVVKAVISDQVFIIEQLENYITGGTS